MRSCIITSSISSFLFVSRNRALSTKPSWGFDWRHGSIAYKLQQGAKKRRSLSTLQLPSEPPPVDDSKLETFLTTMAKTAINEIRPIEIQFIDLPEDAVPYPLEEIEKRTLIPKLYELLTLIFLSPIPDQLTSNHMNRIRILRALAPVICNFMNQTFNEALGECVEPPRRIFTNYQTWNLTSFIDIEGFPDSAKFAQGLGDLTEVLVGIEEHWPDYEHADLSCPDEII